MNFSQDQEVHFKYIQVCKLVIRNENDKTTAAFSAFLCIISF